MSIRLLLLVALPGCELVFPLRDKLDAAVVIDDGTTDTGVSGCPAGYLPVGSTFLKVHAVREVTWSQAEVSCEGDTNGVGGTKVTHLMVAANAAELDLLAQVIDAADPPPQSKEAWIGFTDVRTEGQYHWVTVEDADNSFGKTVLPPGVPPWNPDEPNDDVDAGDPEGEDCAAYIAASGGLNDLSCKFVRLAVCECDEAAIRPP